MSDSPVGSRPLPGLVDGRGHRAGARRGRQTEPIPGRWEMTDVGLCLSRGPNPPRSISMSLQTSLPKCKFKCKIKNFQMAITDD